MKYQGIIFDFNGVILWDTEWHVEAWLKVSKEAGAPLTEKQIENFHGRIGIEIFRSLLGDDTPKNELKKWIQRKEEIYREIAVSKGDKFSLSPGCKKLFDLLKTNNISRTIATASEKTNLDFFVKNLSLAKWFDVDQIVYDDGNLPGKPAPDIFLRAAKNIGLSPTDCIIVEDSKMGLAAAKNAGAGSIIALGPEENKKTLAQTSGVDQVIVQLNEITLDYFKLN